MISLKLRQAGDIVNHEHIERLYAEERLQLKRRRHKNVPVARNVSRIDTCDSKVIRHSKTVHSSVLQGAGYCTHPRRISKIRQRLQLFNRVIVGQICYERF